MNAYEYGRNLAVEELTKEAGIRELLRFLGTGRTTAYHGTSVGRAKNIMKQGIRPRAQKGVSETVKDTLSGLPVDIPEHLLDPRGSDKTLSFLTRSKGNAKTYASQQALLDYTGGKPLAGAVMEGDLGRKDILPMLKKVLGARKKGVVESHLPRHVKRVRNPEPEVLRNRMSALYRGQIDDTGIWDALESIEKPVNKALDWRITKAPDMRAVTNLPFKNTFAVSSKHPGLRPPPSPGKVYPALKNPPSVPTRYIKGSKDYQKFTPQEFKHHLFQSVKHPLRTGADALRSLTGIEHLI